MPPTLAALNTRSALITATITAFERTNTNTPPETQTLTHAP